MCRIVSDNNLNGVTIVPNRFIDEYMVDADDNQLKVYLYLLRFLYTPGVDIAFEAIAEALDLTKQKVKKALKYWEGLGILHYREDAGGNIDRIYMVPLDSAGADKHTEDEKEEEKSGEKAEEKAEEKTEEKAEVEPGEKPVKADIEAFRAGKKVEVYLPEDYTRKQLDILSLDETFKKITEEIEEKYYFPYQLVREDIVLLAGVYESIGFSEKMIDYLYSYCRERKKENMSNKAFTNFVKKVAVSWAEKGLKTPEEQQASEQMSGKLYYEIIKVLGLRGNPLPKGQNDEINKWIYEYQLPGDVILTACNRAIDLEKEKPFGYTKKKLTEWHEKDVKSLEDVEKLDKKNKDSADKERKGKKQPYNSFTDYDYKKMSDKENEELVARLMKKNENSGSAAKLEERLAGSKTKKEA